MSILEDSFSISLIDKQWGGELQGCIRICSVSDLKTRLTHHSSASSFSKGPIDGKMVGTLTILFDWAQKTLDP